MDGNDIIDDNIVPSTRSHIIIIVLFIDEIILYCTTFFEECAYECSSTIHEWRLGWLRLLLPLFLLCCLRVQCIPSYQHG